MLASKSAKMASYYAKLRVLPLFFVIAFFFINQPAEASHLVGGDLSVDRLDSNRYEITLNYFFDCGGNPGAFASDTPPTVNYESAKCGQSGSTNLSSIKGTGKDIAPICSKRSSRCQAGNTKGIQNWKFRDTVTLPQQCTDWKFYWYEDARSEAITTLQNPGNESLYLEARINNDSFPGNNVPEFTNSPVAFICKGQDFVFNNGVVDPEGDSLVYSLYKPKSYEQNFFGPDSSVPVSYKSGYSYQQPLKSSPPVSIDSSTGDVKLSPTKIDTTVLGVRVEEFDSTGTLKSSILRDIQVIITSCSSPSAPDLTGVSDSADQYNSTNVNFDTTVCPGQPVNFFVNASEPNGNDTLYMAWNGTIPGATFQVFQDSTTSPYGKFSWTPPNPNAGSGIQRNTFTVSVRDNNCPYYTEISRGFVVNVVPSKTVDLGDTAYVACDDSLKLKPRVKGASADSNLTYDWSTGAKGDSIYIQEPGRYAVTVRDSGNCPITDSITVLPSLDPSYRISSSFAADRGCVNDSTQFTDSSQSEEAVVNSWDWEFGDGDTSDLQNPKHKFGDTGNYAVQLIVADTNGCQDTLNQSIAIDSKPRAAFAVNPACSRDSSTFTDQSSISKGTIRSFQWKFGDGDSIRKASPQHVYDTGALYTASLEVATRGGCRDTARQTFRIDPKPRADFTSDNTCIGLKTQFAEQATIEAEDSVTGYQWQLRPGVSASSPDPATTYNSQGIYNVSMTATSSNGCSDQATQPIRINPQPQVNTLADTTFCKGDSVSLTTTVSPAPKDTLFQDNFDGGVQSGNWLSTSLGSTGSYCGTQQGSDALYFDGDGSEREAITKDLDTRKADTLTFYFKYGTDNNNIPFPVNGCDGIEGGETVSVAYSTDGGSTWNTLRTLPEGTYTQSGFKRVDLILPPAAKKPSTRFRWKQNAYDNCNSGLFGTRCFDNWALDDVKISNQVDYQFSWRPGNGLSDTSVLIPKAKTTQPETYQVRAIDTAFDCTVNDSVKLTPQTVTADFSSSAPVCEYSDATYTDQSSIQNGSLSASRWNFGDGDSSTLTDPAHRFPDGGSYNVKLVRSSGIGCQDSITRSDSVYQQPQAAFTHDTACLGETTQFTDQATIPADTVSQYQWDFAGNGSSTTASPSFTFGAADSFAVTMIAGSSQGCTDTLSRYVDVGGIPRPDFSLSSVCEKATTSFTDRSTVSYDSLVSRNWQLGDGTTASGPSPAHTYDTNGQYPVQLTVTSNFGCTDSIQQQQTVNPRPEAGFRTPDSAQCLRGNQFKPRNTTIIDSGQLNYTWAFGDDSTSTSTQPAHTYADTGQYKLSLIATSQEGCSDSTSATTTVHPMPVAAFSVNEGAQCLTNNQFRFQSQATIPKGSQTPSWDFGDGDAASAPAPSHSYTKYGTYQAQLVSTSGKGCRDTARQNLRVNPKPQPGFTYSQDSAQCVEGNQFDFTRTSTIAEGNLNSQWQFGNGDQTTGQSPAYSYSNPGNYSVKLISRSDSGCRDSITRQVTIHPMPDAAVSVPDSAQCRDPNRFQLQNNTTISKGSLSYLWDFDNGNQASRQNPVVQYSSARQYRVQLIATSGKGCPDTALQALTVHPEPLADFTVGDKAQCLQRNNFRFTDQTSLSQGSLSYSWTFGDGEQSSQASPVHSYQQVDTFAVEQAVSSDKGCLDTATAQVFTDPDPEARASVEDREQCLEPHEFAFANTSTVSSAESLRYQWQFGDGNTSTRAEPRYRYDSPDSYEPELIVTSDSGCRDTTQLQIRVAPQTDVAFSVDDTLQCKQDHEFRFRNESSEPTASMDYFWFFGDGQSARSETASHTYDATGSYQVRLATRTADGCRDTLQRSVYVKPNPEADFTADRGCAGQSLTFRNRSQIAEGQIVKWTYAFGNGDTSSGPNPSHTYQKGGQYEASLVTTSQFGCPDTAVDSVRIYRIPEKTPVTKATTTLSDRNKVQWERPRSPIPSFYRIERARDDGSFRRLTSVPKDQRSYTDEAVSVDSHTYQYRVQLIDSCRNEGPYSDPNQPIQLQADEGKGNPVLEWTRYQGWPVIAYQVQVEKPNGEGFEPLGPYRRVAPTRQQLVDSLSDLKAGQLCYRIIGFRAGVGSVIQTASNTRCIDPTIRLYVPDAFSPNDDGNNDAFSVEGTYITDITLRIYNRWGEKVFQDSGMEASWDGTYRGQTAPAGTYTYVISAKGANSEFIQREGSLQLIR